MHLQCSLSEDQPNNVRARGHTNSVSLDCNLLRRRSRDSLDLSCHTSRLSHHRTSERQSKKPQLVRHLQRVTLYAYLFYFLGKLSQVNLLLVKRHGCSFCLTVSYGPCCRLSEVGQQYRHLTNRKPSAHHVGAMTRRYHMRAETYSVGPKYRESMPLTLLLAWAFGSGTQPAQRYMH